MLLLDHFKLTVFELADEHHLTRPQLFVLYWIRKHGELAMGQVAQVLHCDASNVTGIVDRLVTQNMIDRRESPQDRRTKALHLTAHGQKIIDAMVAALPSKMGYTTLSADEQAALHRITQKLCSQPGVR